MKFTKISIFILQKNEIWIKFSFLKIMKFETIFKFKFQFKMNENYMRQ